MPPRLIRVEERVTRERPRAWGGAGIVGPRGDAYESNRTITASEAEDYHSEQLATLARADVDLVEAMTFNSIDEVIGLARAARSIGLPLSVSFTLDNSTLMTAAALGGIALAWVPEWTAQPYLDQKQLVAVMSDWSPTFPGLCLYYPPHRHSSAGLRAFVALIRERFKR